MSLIKPGDIVIRMGSKANAISKKVYRVIDRVPAGYTEKWRVADHKGRQQEINGWKLRTLESALRILESRATATSTAYNNAQHALHEFSEDMKKIPTLFPPI